MMTNNIKLDIITAYVKDNSSRQTVRRYFPIIQLWH